MKSLQTLSCNIKDYPEIKAFVHKHGGATSENYIIADKALMVVHLLEEERLYLLLKYPDIVIQKRTLSPRF